jgi:hypothetical protein
MVSLSYSVLGVAPNRVVFSRQSHTHKVRGVLSCHGRINQMYSLPLHKNIKASGQINRYFEEVLHGNHLISVRTC